jgi:hypothetical protein
MKFLMFTLVACAAIAFAAPLASAHEIITEHSYLSHKAVKHVKTHGNTARGSTKGQTTPKPPLYLTVPGFSGTAASSPNSTGECLINQDNCTDQQLCDGFGINCSTAVEQPGSTLPAATVTAGGVTSDDFQVAAATLAEAQSTPAPVVASASSDESNDDC